MIPRSRILGTGHFLPPIVRTNYDIEKMGVETSDAWIRERTGIGTRHIAPEGMVTSDMAAEAAKSALLRADVAPKDIDMIIVGTITPDMPMPATAAYVQQKIGANPTCPSFDIAAACAGFVYAISIADKFVASGAAKHVLVIGVEMLSRVVNWKDRTTCVLFGDGAGAAVVGPARGDGRGILATSMFTDGSLARSLMIPGGGTETPQGTPRILAENLNTIQMKGQDIFKAAVKNLYSASQGVVDSVGLKNEEVDWVVPHQANLRIIDQVTARAKYPKEKVLSNIERVGNTSSASIPILLDEKMRAGVIREGDVVLSCAFGAGVSWGAALMRM